MIHHLALYCKDLEKTRLFYETYFDAESNEKYVNSKKGFESYFLFFGRGSKLEIMSRIGIEKPQNLPDEIMGLTHFAISVSSEGKVKSLTERLRVDGYEIASECRWTGDGYFESVVLDPEGNRVEICI